MSKRFRVGTGGGALDPVDRYGDYTRATSLFQQRLKLPHNRLNFDVWFKYARFLMRVGQRQREAETALRYAISIKRDLQHTDAESISLRVRRPLVGTESRPPGDQRTYSPNRRPWTSSKSALK